MAEESKPGRPRRPLWDYLFYDKKLPRKPEVIDLAVALKQSRYWVVGALLELWSWADDHYPGGVMTGINFQKLSVIFPEFGADFFSELSKTGWITQHEGGIVIANANRWFGDTSKKRMQDRLRKWCEQYNQSLIPENVQPDSKGFQNSSEDRPPEIRLLTDKKEKETCNKYPPTPKGGKGGRSGDPRFEVFWKAYPRRQSKSKARKAWDKLNPSDELVDTILAAVERQKKTAQWLKDGGQFVPHPATWINGGCWEDETQSQADVYFDKMNELFGGQS